MSTITSVAGRGIPLTGNDIDTDRIIPARFLRCVSFDGLGDQVFKDDRAAQGGQHPFDQPQYQDASILVVNSNFGCGSSREHAPQSLSKWGIQAVVGESFAEIFFGNCVALGIPCVTASPAQVGQLQSALVADPSLKVTVDLNAMQVTWAEQQIAVEMLDGPRSMFVTGQWDSCGQLVANASQIRETATGLPYIAWAS
ncbi:MAG: 3-isopropylmalate dehydratase small subunit [Spirulina sp. SIO3F2]|nr:3-isopropylmalate dehydratase small subunit [Spirulina sp. SIO3F2]